jgi:predicted GNAT family N-acyltransferase
MRIHPTHPDLTAAATAPVVREAAGEREIAAALELRRRVFCDEQGVPANLELDGRDGDALQLVAVDSSGDVVGTCRLLFARGATALLGRMAVAARLRGRGIGRALLDLAEQRAQARGAKRIALHAQETARSLYAAAGFEVYGEPFVEAGIPHVAMEKRLA